MSWFDDPDEVRNNDFLKYALDRDSDGLCGAIEKYDSDMRLVQEQERINSLPEIDPDIDNAETLLEESLKDLDSTISSLEYGIRNAQYALYALQKYRSDHFRPKKNDDKENVVQSEQTYSDESSSDQAFGKPVPFDDTIPF